MNKHTIHTAPKCPCQHVARLPLPKYRFRCDFPISLPIDLPLLSVHNCGLIEENQPNAFWQKETNLIQCPTCNYVVHKTPASERSRFHQSASFVCRSRQLYWHFRGQAALALHKVSCYLSTQDKLNFLQRTMETRMVGDTHHLFPHRVRRVIEHGHAQRASH